MVDGFLLAAVLFVAVYVNRQADDGFCQDANVAVNCRHLHRGPFGHFFVGGRAAEEKEVAAARRAVGRLVTGVK